MGYKLILICFSFCVPLSLVDKCSKILRNREDRRRKFEMRNAPASGGADADSSTDEEAADENDENRRDRDNVTKNHTTSSHSSNGGGGGGGSDKPNNATDADEKNLNDLL